MKSSHGRSFAKLGDQAFPGTHHCKTSCIIPIPDQLATCRWPELLIDIDGCGPTGSVAGAKRPRVAEGREGERSETVVPEAIDETDNKTRD